MKDNQFAILMSGLFLIGFDITNNKSLLILAIAWLLMALLPMFRRAD